MYDLLTDKNFRPYMSQIKEYLLHPIKQQHLDLPLGAVVLGAEIKLFGSAYMIKLAVVINPQAMTERVSFVLIDEEEEFSGAMVNKYIGSTPYGYLFQMIM